MPIDIQIMDRRTIQCAIPADAADTAAFVAACGEAAAHGYVLKGASSIEGGHQRDPYTIGLRVIFEKP